MNERTSPITEDLPPFLKWAGGKRWFVERHAALIPDCIDRYFEPFAGSASVFFSIHPTSAVLSDANGELIVTYSAIQNQPHLVARYLRQHANAHSDEYYYLVRSSAPRSAAARAARLIYLNRTCWNGLYRVNRKGMFNVPRGTKNTVIFDTDDFVQISRRLQNTELVHADFETVLARSGAGDFVFLDPPYTVRHNLNGFRKYNEKIFSWDDQVRLSEVCVDLDSRGVRFLMTNANHESVKTLYRHHFETIPVSRQSVIAANRDFRNEVSELIVKNY